MIHVSRHETNGLGRAGVALALAKLVFSSTMTQRLAATWRFSRTKRTGSCDGWAGLWGWVHRERQKERAGRQLKLGQWDHCWRENMWGTQVTDIVAAQSFSPRQRQTRFDVEHGTRSLFTEPAATHAHHTRHSATGLLPAPIGMHQLQRTILSLRQTVKTISSFHHRAETEEQNKLYAGQK